MCTSHLKIILTFLLLQGGGQASHLMHTTQHRCSNQVREGGEEWKEGRDGRRHERDREVEGGGALELAATCRSTSIMGTLQTTSAI